MKAKIKILYILRSIKRLSHIVFKEISFVIGGFLIIFIIGALLGFNYIELWIYPLVKGRNPNAKMETLKFLGYIVGGILLLWQIVLTNKRTHSTEQTASAALANVKLVERGQIQERFKNAIEQLGSESEAVNLGSIYTLHQVAQESELLRKVVFEIFCSYIRASSIITASHPPEKVSIKVQSILNLIFVDKKERCIYDDYRKSADFRDTFLTKAFIPFADLRGIKLNNAILNKATLFRSDMTNINLNGVQLKGADLSCVKFEQAKLINVNLSDAILNGTNLSKVDFQNTDFNGVQFGGTAFNRGAIVGSSDWFQKLREKKCTGIEYLEKKYFISHEKDYHGEGMVFVLDKRYIDQNDFEPKGFTGEL